MKASAEQGIHLPRGPRGRLLLQVAVEIGRQICSNVSFGFALTKNYTPQEKTVTASIVQTPVVFTPSRIK
jgi:hypothetical protein